MARSSHVFGSFLVFLIFWQSCVCLLEERFVAFEKVKGAVEIQSPLIITDSDDAAAVHIAARSLSTDYKEITGTQPIVLEYKGPNARIKSGSVAVIAATVNSKLIKRLENDGKLNVSEIKGKWESFMTLLVKDPLPGIKNALIIVGSDKRGAAFGVYTLCEQMGQSPLHYWGDVPATKHEKIYALPKATFHGEPSIKYRGLFINDEAPALTHWWGRTTKNETNFVLDTEFYTLVFDLIVRLKGNFMWPAMWHAFAPNPGRKFFTDDPGNAKLADDYGIVVSTSHHEPMQRAANEWDGGEWNWVENREKVAKFMEEGVERNGDLEAYFTLGMRGSGDTGVDAEDPVAVLKDVISTQREMIAKYHDGNESAVPQVWAIYKEVQGLYESGVVPPEDVTLLFADDNWGNTRRLGVEEELERSGGTGLYFHFEYVGEPKSYKWHNSNNYPKMYKELYHAYERGAHQIWIFNVGDIKPMELPLSFCMDVAWNTTNFGFKKITDYLHAMAARDFGDDHADEVSYIMEEYSRLVGLRRYEMIFPETFSILNYHEAERILSAWDDLASRSLSLHESVGDELKDALFNLVVYPAMAGWTYFEIVINRAKNYQHSLERRNSANTVARNVLDSFSRDWDLVEQFQKIGGGKWDGLMETPKYDTGMDWGPSSGDVLTNLSWTQDRQPADYALGDMGIYAEGSRNAALQGRFCAPCDPTLPTQGEFEPLLQTITPYGPDIRIVELYHRGDYRKPISWEAAVPYDWVHVSKLSGVLSESQLDQRLEVSVDWDAVPSGFNDMVNITVKWDPKDIYFDHIQLPVDNTRAPESFNGFVAAAQGYISMEAPHYQRSSDDTIYFEAFPGLSTRSDSGSVGLRPFKEARRDNDAAQAAWIEYDTYIFGTQNLTATIYVTMGLDTDPNLLMQYSLLLDSDEADFVHLLEEPKEVGDVPKDWDGQVADGVWTRTVDLGTVDEGAHVLRWQVNSPELYLEKIVLNVGSTAPVSYLGPPETKLV